MHATATAAVGSTGRASTHQALPAPRASAHRSAQIAMQSLDRPPRAIAPHCLRRALPATTTAQRIVAGTKLLRNEALLLSGATRIRSDAR